MAEGPVAGRTLAEARRRLGSELGASDWVTIDQARIDAHAATTGDRDWLHNDPERAAREGPYGGTIAQGSLVLSLLVGFVNEIAPFADDIAFALNYGFDRVRFVRPVPVGSRVRARMRLADLRPKGPGRWLAVIDARIEREGADEPALVAEWLGLVLEKGAAP
jgi:acyl dehydratase